MSVNDRTSRKSGPSPEGALWRKAHETPRLNVVVALASEAKPLIDHWGLDVWSGDSGRSPQVFAGEISVGGGGRVMLRLLVSGMGRIASATAVGVLHGVDLVQGPGLDLNPRLPVFWLNLGICGHGRRPVGDAILATEVHDVTAGHRFELHRSFEAPCDVAELETHDARVTTYPPGDRVVDMEAAGFVAAARRCGAKEGDDIQCLKIVADNAERPPRDVTRRAERRVLAMETERHMAQLLPIVDALCARWMATALPHRMED